MKASIPEFTPPCRECGGRCCKYVALEIDRPTNKKDRDNIRWYLHHENIAVFVDHDNKWYIEFRTPCLAQDGNGSCTVYETRPLICRDHGNTDGECEYYDSPFLNYFSVPAHFDEFLLKRESAKKARAKKK